MGAGAVIVCAALETLAGPVVVPVGAGGQIHLAAGRALFGDWRHQKRRPEHVLIAQVGHIGIVGEVERAARA